jgi:hypothetical protein
MNFEDLQLYDMFEYYGKVFIKRSQSTAYNKDKGIIRLHPKDQVTFIDKEELKRIGDKTDDIL